MNTQVFEKGMALLMGTFPRIEFNSKLYWEMLKDLKDQVFEEAVLRVIQTTAEIYPNSNLIAIIRRHALGEIYPSVGEAWLNACEQAGCMGYDKPVAWLNPLVREAAEMIGVYEIRTSENPALTRAHFFKVYEDLVLRQKEREVLKIAQARPQIEKK